jgi:hypothetical protein
MEKGRLSRLFTRIRFSTYAAVSHSMTNTTVATVAEVTGAESGVTMAL